jgi:hypothetical protein
MKSTSRGTAVLALAILVAAAGCTQSDVLNTGTYQVTLVTDVDDPGIYECVLVDILELHLESIQHESPGGLPVRALVPNLGGPSAGGLNPGVRNVNFTNTSCPIGQCTVSSIECGDDSVCTGRQGECFGSPGLACQRDIDCPDVGQGSATCDSTCTSSRAMCTTSADCDTGDTCLPPAQGLCLVAGTACTTTADCPDPPNDLCDFRTCRGTSTPCAFDFDCSPPDFGSCSNQNFCQTTRRPCTFRNPPQPGQFRCDPGDTCLAIDACVRFNSRNAPPSFPLSEGTYRIISLIPSSYDLVDLDEPANTRTCGVAEGTGQNSSRELVGVANDQPEDLVFSVGPGLPNQIVLTVMDVEGLAQLADPLSPVPGCYTNERERYFDLRDPSDVP